MIELLAYAAACFEHCTNPFETLHLSKKKITADECKDLSEAIATILAEHIEWVGTLNGRESETDQIIEQANSFAEVKRQIKKKNRVQSEKFESRPFAVAFENDLYEDVEEQALPEGGYRAYQLRERQEMLRVTEQDFQEKYAAESAALMQNPFVNCLVLNFRNKDFLFAVQILSAKFRMSYTKKTQELLKHPLRQQIRTLTLMGTKQTTELMKIELQKHSIKPRILRDNYFRRSNMHYYKGKVYNASNHEFKEMKLKLRAFSWVERVIRFTNN
jgi:hypothetical protein